jgi:UDP-N-acetylmuramoyl-tripeptide--D-alanyl-D-alanine ligase
VTLKISFQKLGALLEAEFIGAPESLLKHVAVGISTDTRELQPGNLFVALRGDRFDGHGFVAQAMAKGAVGAIVDTPTEAASQFLVPDTLVAYQAISRWWRQHLNTPLVGITGSVGKTTTKELVAAALATQGGGVLKTQANYNNEIGVPKTLLELNESHQFGVIEMGMRGRGQIALLTQIAQPNVGVITNVGTAHIELLGSEQAIAEAKCELLAELDPGGIAVLNYDNERLMRTAEGVWAGTLITFGLEGGDVQGRLLDGTHLEVQGVVMPLPLPGQHNALNFLAAIAVMEAFKLDWKVLQAGLSLELPQGRAARWASANDILLLDETYNAGYESMKAALHLLKETPGQRHIAVLGTMKELGEFSISLHQEVGREVERLQLDYLVILADPQEADALMTGAGNVPGHAFATAEDLIMWLESFLQPGDRVLFKASRAVALDQVVAQVRARLGG